MKRIAKTKILPAGLACLLLSMTAAAGINENIHIDDGARSGGETSVNGSITVGDDASVSGGLRTVNGSIRAGSRATLANAQTVNGKIVLADNVVADSLETVNGSIEIGEAAVVDDDVVAVNGSIRLGQNARVGGNVSNVNGSIELRGGEVGGDLETTSGDVELSDGAVVLGDLVVEKPANEGWFDGMRRDPRVVIGPGCRVDGTLRLEREVRLFISDSAIVGGVEGVMSMDDARRFSGNRP
jgi:DUF4097 and DUF4098 domain-containing protein YvlB